MNTAVPGSEVLLEIVQPANETDCPSLRFDGVLWHDPKQPYGEVLPLEGCQPQVVALCGVGLAYAAAGALQLAPDARILAWEPLPGMAERARKILRDEWQLEEKVIVESELADFQARLIELCRDADRLATVENPGFASSHPALTQHFREIVQQVVDAGTLSFAPRRSGEEKWTRLLANFEAVAQAPPLSRLGGVFMGRTAIAIASAPDARAMEALRSANGGHAIVTIPDVAPLLLREGIHPDVVVVGKGEAPSAELANALAPCVLAVTPDSDPAWWTTSCAGRLVLGHTGCAWLMPEDDPAKILSFRWGEEIPLALGALALGASRVLGAGFSESADARWNWLAASRRRDRVIERVATSSGASAARWNGEPLPEAPLDPLPELAPLCARAEALGGDSLRQTIARARAAVLQLGREHRRHAELLPPTTLEPHLGRRAEGQLFTRAFFADTEIAGRDFEARETRALAFLTESAHRIPGTERAAAPATRAGLRQRSDTLVVYLGDEPGESLAGELLRSQVKRLSSRPVEVLRLSDRLRAVFGPRATELPRALRVQLIPTLCDRAGRAIYVEPSVLMLEDPAALWELDLEGAAALAPLLGPPSLLLIDCERAAWHPEEILSADADGRTKLAERLRPGVSTGVGVLPETWCLRDDVRLDACAVRYTCDPWVPWRSDLHPIRWLWEFQLHAAIAEGRIGAHALARAAERGELRPELLLDVLPELPHAGNRLEDHDLTGAEHALVSES